MALLEITPLLTVPSSIIQTKTPLIQAIPIRTALIGIIRTIMILFQTTLIPQI